MGIFGEKKTEEIRIETNKLVPALEALLFLYGDPIEAKKAAQLLGVLEGEVEVAAKELKESLAMNGRGLALVMHGKKLQMTTRPESAHLLETLMKADLHDVLTSAALETLSIIAYGAPVTRAEIDYVRGVNSTFIIRQLLLRGLIERGTETGGRSYTYGPSMDFIRHLGFSKIEDLPEYERFRNLMVGIRQGEKQNGEN